MPSVSRKMPKQPLRLAVIAGSGQLPLLIAAHCDPFILAIIDETDPSLVKNRPHLWVKMTEVGKALAAFRERGITDIVMAGRIRRPDLKTLKPDKDGMRLLTQLMKPRRRGDDALFRIVAGFFEGEGFRVLGVKDVMKTLLAPKKCLTKTKPNKAMKGDVKLGFHLVKELGKYDIGQALIIQEGLVLAVEAAEGTDLLMRRAKTLQQKAVHGAVLVKGKKPHQEARVDLPTIGVDTVKHAHEAGFSGIAIEAGETLILNKDEVVAAADKHGLFVVGL